jgi:hypothetical protein
MRRLMLQVLMLAHRSLLVNSRHGASWLWRGTEGEDSRLGRKASRIAETRQRIIPLGFSEPQISARLPESGAAPGLDSSILGGRKSMAEPRPSITDWLGSKKYSA